MSVTFKDSDGIEFIVPGPDDTLSGLQQIFGEEAQCVYAEMFADFESGWKRTGSAEMSRIHVETMQKKMGGRA